jgi:hypothetical protein
MINGLVYYSRFAGIPSTKSAVFPGRARRMATTYLLVLLWVIVQEFSHKWDPSVKHENTILHSQKNTSLYLKQLAISGRWNTFEANLDNGPFFLKHMDDKGDHILVDEDIISLELLIGHLRKLCLHFRPLGLHF